MTYSDIICPERREAVAVLSSRLPTFADEAKEPFVGAVRMAHVHILHLEDQHELLWAHKGEV